MIWGILLVVFRAGLHFRMVSSTIRANILQFVPKLLQFSEKTSILYIISIRWELIAMRKGTTFSRNRPAFLGKQFGSQKITYNTGAQLA